MTERPTVLSTDGSHRLHGVDGPALLYSDGWGIWSWHGVHVPRQVIESPETLAVEQIAEEHDVEIRRVMLERFGFERYIRESGAKIIHKDDWGTMWRIDLSGDEPLVMVEVVNSTPELDGTFKNYMLRVPPTMWRSRQAIAWTFGLTEWEYIPSQQT